MKKAIVVLVLTLMLITSVTAHRDLDRSEPLGEDCKVYKYISNEAKNKVAGVVVRSGEKCYLSIDATSESNYVKLLEIAKELRHTEPTQLRGTWFAYVREYLRG